MRKTKKSRRRSQAESAALKAAGLNEEAAAEAAEWESLACDCERRLADERARNALLEAELARARAAAGADCAKAGPDRSSLARSVDLSSPQGILRTLEAFYPDRVAVLPSAYASAGEYAMTDAQGTWEVALSAAESVWPLAFEGCGERLADAFQAETGLELARGEGKMTKADPRHRAARTVEYQGRELDISPHVKGRGKRGVRMHFAVDKESCKVVIGHFGEHMATSGSRRRGFK